VCEAGKRLENRTFPPPRRAVGRPLAIHAGKHLDEDAVLGLGFDGFQVPDEGVLARGAVVAVCTLAGCVDREPVGDPQQRWWCGPYGWLLDDVVPLPTPVACRGRQGLWRLDEECAYLVDEQLGKAAP
jgi:hypothetical protein